MEIGSPLSSPEGGGWSQQRMAVRAAWVETSPDVKEEAFSSDSPGS